MIENNRHTFKYVVGEQHVEMPHITDQYGIRFAIFLRPSVYLFAERFPKTQQIPSEVEYFPRFFQDLNALCCMIGRASPMVSLGY